MTTADFRPTHVVPQVGLPAWEAPDVNRPTAPLDALLPVQLVDRLGDWGRIVCANGWSAWVDGRLLVAVPQDPPGASGPPARTADPRPLLARTEDALSGYRRAAEDLAGGRADGESFRRRTRGLRVGVVVDGESVWLYDTEHERWVYCDGVRLSTYAAGAGPSVVGRGGGDGGTAVVDAGAGAGAGADGGAGAGARDVGVGGGKGTVRPEAQQHSQPPPSPPDGSPVQVVQPGVPSPEEEPTAVVPAVPGTTEGGGGGAGPGETRVVEAAAAGSGTARAPVGEAPDRRGPGAPGASAGGRAGPEPTQVVAVEADPEEAPGPSDARAAPRGGRRPAPLLPPETADPAPPLRPGDG
ncbi:hypothetical protein [Streptomyces sp. NPDC007172]|uniref:hypothetical protein n=1 Tax=Streptomyces sp. NPDC007172 TaxID=3364776 RepID=UPI003684AD06